LNWSVGWAADRGATPEPLSTGRVEAFLKIGGREIFLLGWDFPEIPPNTNLRGPTLHVRLDRWETDRLILALRVKAVPSLDSQYHLAYRGKARQTAVTTAMLNT
jgi:hypothetical protein